jgi:hypothetical protein
MRFAANSLWRESKVSNERTTHSIGIAEPAVAGDLIKRTRARLDRGPRAFQSRFRWLGACPSSHWSSGDESDSLLGYEQGISSLEDR